MSGNGTTSNPYIISGWSVSSTVSSCVDVESTTAYFIIENLQVNCGSFTMASIALTLGNVSNGEVLSSYLFPAAYIMSSKNDGFSGNTLQGGGCGAQACLQTAWVLDISHSSSITVSNNQISLGEFGSCVVGADHSSDLHLANNTVQNDDTPCGVGLYATNNSVISQNRITRPCCGPYLFANTGLSIYNSLNDQVFANNILQEQNGITIVSTNNTSIYHNNLINNNVQASENDSISNQWDNGYPSGGNYWSTYTGVDNCSGPQQDTCPGPDGIGDTPYSIPRGVYVDRYPLMKPFVASPLVSIVEGLDGNLYSSLSRPDGSWNSWQSLSGSASSPPVPCRSGPDRVDLVVRGMDNGLYHKTFVNGTWSGWDSLGGLTRDQPACAVLNGSIYVLVRGMDNSTYYDVMNLLSGSWSGWTSLSGSTPSAPVVVATPGPSRLDLFVRGMDNSVYYKTFINGAWSSNWNPLSIATVTSPAASSDGSFLYLVVVGPDSSLWYNSLSFSSNTWTGWTSLQGSTPSTPVLVSTPGLNRLDIVVRGMNNVVYHKSLVNGVWSSAWDSFNGLTLHTPSAVSDGSNLRLVVVSMDNSLLSNLLPLSSAQWSGWTRLAGSTAMTPALA